MNKGIIIKQKRGKILVDKRGIDDLITKEIKCNEKNFGRETIGKVTYYFYYLPAEITKVTECYRVVKNDCNDETKLLLKRCNKQELLSVEFYINKKTYDSYISKL